MTAALIDGFTDEQIRAQLARVVASASFARNTRLTRFLQLLVDRRCAGRDDELKESLIAVEIFNRRPDYDPKQDSIVRTEASRLRARLLEYYSGDGAADPIVIDVPKGRYVPFFRAGQAITAAPAPEPANVESAGGRRWLAVAIACAAVLAIAVGAAWFNTRHSPYRVAVLPFLSVGPDSSDDYIADGLTDELIRNLMTIEGLEVRSQTSSFALKGQTIDARKAGERLNVEYLVEGSAVREGERLRISARLVRALDDVPIWSARFDRQTRELVSAQADIANGIANHLRLQLGEGRRRYETSLSAYDQYLRARASVAGVNSVQAVADPEMFRRVLEIDPLFAPAQAGLAMALVQRTVTFPVEHSPTELDEARRATARARELDPLLSEAHSAMGVMQARDGQWDLAEQSFRRALVLAPNDSLARTNLVLWVLLPRGRLDEAYRELALAERADPLSTDIQLPQATVLMSLGRFDEAADHCERMSPADELKIQCLARTHLGQKRFEQAIDLLTHDPNVVINPQGRGFLGFSYAKAGRVSEAQALIDSANTPNELALIYAGLGDVDRTIAALDRMTLLGPQRFGRYLSFPEFALVRDDERVHDIRRRAGLK